MSQHHDRHRLPARSRARTTSRPPSADARSKAKTIALGEAEATSVASIMESLPDPTELEGGTLVVVEGAVKTPPSLARSVLAVFGRTKSVSRSLRCTALVARGYVRVGAADDDRADLTWGYAPNANAPSDTTDDRSE